VEECFWLVLIYVLLLAAFHEVSVYPKKDLPFFILFTAGLCSFTALLAVLTHQYPEPMGTFARVVCSLFASPPYHSLLLLFMISAVRIVFFLFRIQSNS